MRKTKLSAVIATFLVCFAFWLLLTWSVKPQELIVGAVVSLAAALFSARFFIHEKRSGWPIPQNSSPVCSIGSAYSPVN